VVVAGCAIAGSVAFVVGGATAAGLGTGGVVLFLMGAASCSLLHRAARRRSQAGLHGLIDLGRELESVRRPDDLPWCSHGTPGASASSVCWC
jgi:hypothetical protein